MKNTTESFEELIIPRKDLHISDAMIYRVYSDKKNFELVEAVSALDAMSQSKIKNIYKIERHDPMANNVIHLRQVLGGFPPVENIISENKVAEELEQVTLPQSEAAPAIVIEAENVPIAEPEPEPEVSVPVADVALSNDEVEKLLNG